MSNLRFKLGEKVRVPKYNDVGTIVDIDTDWVYPYEVEFESGNVYDEELFIEEDLEPMLDIEEDKSYINIKFQEGAILENGVNGCQIEDVINLLVERLKGFQKGGFPCRENALAITKLEEARMWLEERTRKRKEQGVEGRMKSHE